MPNIDVSTIEGFDTMSAEEKVAALTAYELPEMPDMSKFVSKDAFDKKASEAALLSKQLKGKMTEEDQRKADLEAKEEERNRQMEELRQQNETFQNQIKALERKGLVADYSKELLRLNYDEKSAADLAEALVGGDSKKIFTLMRAHDESRAAAVKQELTRQSPQPDGNATSSERRIDVEIAKAISADLPSGSNAGKSFREMFGAH